MGTTETTVMAEQERTVVPELEELKIEIKTVKVCQHPPSVPCVLSQNVSGGCHPITCIHVAQVPI